MRSSLVFLALSALLCGWAGVVVSGADVDDSENQMVTFRLVLPEGEGWSADRFSAMDQDCRTLLRNPNMLDIETTTSTKRVRLVNFREAELLAESSSTQLRNVTLLSLVFFPCADPTCPSMTTAAHASWEFQSLFVGADTSEGLALNPPARFDSDKHARFWTGNNCTALWSNTSSVQHRSGFFCAGDSCLDQLAEDGSNLVATLIIILVVFIVVVVLCACLLLLGTAWVDRKRQRDDIKARAVGHGLGVPSARDIERSRRGMTDDADLDQQLQLDDGDSHEHSSERAPRDHQSDLEMQIAEPSKQGRSALLNMDAALDADDDEDDEKSASTRL